MLEAHVVWAARTGVVVQVTAVETVPFLRTGATAANVADQHSYVAAAVPVTKLAQQVSF